MIPEPTTVAKRKAVPRVSEVRRRAIEIFFMCVQFSLQAADEGLETP
jgi:hypothetical protein